MKAWTSVEMSKIGRKMLKKKNFKSLNFCISKQVYSVKVCIEPSSAIVVQSYTYIKMGFAPLEISLVCV